MIEVVTYQCSNCGLEYQEKTSCAEHEKNCLALKAGQTVIFQPETEDMVGKIGEISKARKDEEHQDVAPQVFILTAEPFFGADEYDNGWAKWVDWKLVTRIVS